MSTTPPPTPEHSDLKQQIISIIMEFHTLNRATGIITAWRPDLAASKIDALIATATAQARREELENCLKACQTRHPMESIDYLEARLRALDGEVK